MRGWTDYELKDVVDNFIDYRGKTPEKTPSGIPLVTAKIVKNGKIQTPNEFIALENYSSWMRRGYPEINDIVMTTEAPLGEVALLKDKNVALAQRIIVIRGKKELCDNAFLKYYLQSPLGQEELHGRASGTTVEGIKASELRRINVSLPSLPEQRAIAGVLSSLDDKIDLLHRQNKTLEAMAEALWRKMFVEEANSGWKKGKLGEYITVKGGTTPSTSSPDLWNGAISWTSPRDLSGSNKIFLNETERKITEKGLSKIGSGLLPIGTVLLSSRAPIGYLAISNIPVAINQGYIAVICEHLLSNYYMYLWIKLSMDLIIASANGSTFMEISKSTFKNMEIDIPGEHHIALFNAIIQPVFNKIMANETEILTLLKCRDILLPKLMSGEARVKYETN